jgi:hypothetical protein
MTNIQLHFDTLFFRDDPASVILVFRTHQGILRRRFSTTAQVEVVFNYLLSEGLHHDQINVRRHNKVELKKDESTLEQQGIVYQECFYVSKIKKK